MIAAHLESMLKTALSANDETYEVLNRCDASTSSVEAYKIAPDELSKSMDIEQQIYDTAYRPEDHGPLYCQPSNDEKKIYDDFEGKRFRKLFYKEIELVDTLLCVLPTLSAMISKQVYKEKLVILQSIGIIDFFKNKETRVVTYTCRYSNGHFNP